MALAGAAVQSISKHSPDKGLAGSRSACIDGGGLHPREMMIDMDYLSTRAQYVQALTFAADLTDAITRVGHGEHGVKRLREPLLQALDSAEQSWSWSDNRDDEALIAGGALRATAVYQASRHALGMPHLAGELTELWPDVGERAAALKSALLFAVHTAEESRGHELGPPVLAPWIRERLDALLAAPAAGEAITSVEARIRHGVRLCHRYSELCSELFGDRTWTGRPVAPWRCPDTDLAVRSPFDGYCNGHAPTYALRLVDDSEGGGGADTDEQNATFTVANRYDPPPVHYPVVIRDGAVHLPDELAADALCAPAVAAALRALGHRVNSGTPIDTTGPCPHVKRSAADA